MKKATSQLLIFFSSATIVFSQTSKKPELSFKQGIGLTAPDSIFSVNLRFRCQLRSAYSTLSTGNYSAREIEARVRRLRLRLDGFMINPKFSYAIQLSFSRGDMDWVDNDNSVVNSSPNVVRDAAVRYKYNEHLTFIFGQTKLPGNRQRVISSGEQQFAERSIVNAAFNIDRDFGVQFSYHRNLSKLVYIFKGAVSSGEGRNSVISDAGLAYTGRLELLPFGDFTNKGDYNEGDLMRESTPKVSLAAGYHHNENAVRTSGTLGKDLYSPSNIDAFIADLLFKYKGVALYGEYISRNAQTPVTINELNQERVIYVGTGQLAQISYLFKNNVEIAGRYAVIIPYKVVAAEESQKEEMGLCLNKYLHGHRVKLQWQIFYNHWKNTVVNTTTLNNWTGTFQIELGI